MYWFLWFLFSLLLILISCARFDFITDFKACGVGMRSESNTPAHTCLSTSVMQKLLKTSKIRVFLGVSVMHLTKIRIELSTVSQLKS